MTSKPVAASPESDVLITGGAGFIGSHLAEALLSNGHRVTVIDDLSTGRLENIAHLDDHPRFSYAIASITSDALQSLAGSAQVIFHLAAAVGVKLVVDDPVHTIETNVMGTHSVLKAAHDTGAKVIVASSSEVYGKLERAPFREDDDIVLGPSSRSRWSYAASKLVDEFLALSYHHQKDLPVVVCRLFNTVGPRQRGRYGMVVPRLVDQALRREPLTVYGDGRQSRCFLHVADAVTALQRLAVCDEAVGEVVNIGSSREVTILELAQLILGAVAKVNPDEPSETRPPRSSGEIADLIAQGEIILIPYEQAYEKGFEDMKRRVPDTTKLRTLTDWHPRSDLGKIIDDIVQSRLY